jgi:hypothetical protein
MIEATPDPRQPGTLPDIQWQVRRLNRYNPHLALNGKPLLGGWWRISDQQVLNLAVRTPSGEMHLVHSDRS